VTSSIDIERLLAPRVLDIETSGIRRAWALAANCVDPINLSIGQPDFPVPDELKAAAIAAIENDHNGYTHTNGDAELLASIEKKLANDVGWSFEDGSGLSAMVTSGTAGALTLACLAILGPGDEIIIPDPYFVIYPTLARIAEAKAVLCDTYPDFRMTADRIEPLISSATKAVLLNSPGNPTGAVLRSDEVEAVAKLCRERGILLITDEIYDEFIFSPTTHASPASYSKDVLVIRGYSKTHGCTGWRLGYAAGPARLLEEMSKLQQQTFVCAPSALQKAAVDAHEIDLSPMLEKFTARRNMVVDFIGDVAELTVPDGSFFAFPCIPAHLGMSGSDFIQKAIEKDVLVIQGSVFSAKDSHFRISFAAADDRLEKGLGILRSLLS
jgi:aspartate/methionine/tyrosine aminotransferase